MGIGQDIYDRLVPEGSPGRGVDAAIARQFDETPGGGIFDGDTYNPFGNSQSDRTEPTTVPGTGITIADRGGSGVGYQPGQGYTPGTAGIGPNDDTIETNFADAREWAEKNNPGDKAGRLLILAVVVLGGFFLLQSLVSGFGEGLAQ